MTTVTITHTNRLANWKRRTVPIFDLTRALLDLVQRPIESSTPIHVLPPRPLLVNIRPAGLIPLYRLVLGRVEAAETHESHHLCFFFFVSSAPLLWWWYLDSFVIVVVPRTAVDVH